MAQLRRVLTLRAGDVRVGDVLVNRGRSQVSVLMDGRQVEVLQVQQVKAITGVVAWVNLRVRRVGGGAPYVIRPKVEDTVQVLR